MSLFDRLDALRHKPKHVRNRFAFSVAAGTTLIVLLVWSTTIPSRLTFFDMHTSAEPAVAQPASVTTKEGADAWWQRMFASVALWREKDSTPHLKKTLPAATSTPTTTPMVWTEAIEKKKTTTPGAKAVLIGTTSAETTASSSAYSVLQ